MEKKLSLLSLPISPSPSVEMSIKAMSESISRKTSMMVTFVNPHAFYLKVVDQGYANCLWHFDLVLADGIGVSKAVPWVTGQYVERQSFDSTSLFRPFLSYLNDAEISIVIVGGKPGVADTAMAKMMLSYPKVRYLGTQNGFQEFDEIIEWIMATQPDVALIGMGAPNQEKILLRLKQSGYNGLGITCGGFLDQYCQSDNYYPQYIDQFNLRFLYRIFKEPKRLIRRYLIEYQNYLFGLIGEIFAKRFPGRGGVRTGGKLP